MGEPATARMLELMDRLTPTIAELTQAMQCAAIRMRLQPLCLRTLLHFLFDWTELLQDDTFSKALTFPHTTRSH